LSTEPYLMCKYENGSSRSTILGLSFSRAASVCAFLSLSRKKEENFLFGYACAIVHTEWPFVYIKSCDDHGDGGNRRGGPRGLSNVAEANSASVLKKKKKKKKQTKSRRRFCEEYAVERFLNATRISLLGCTNAQCTVLLTQLVLNRSMHLYRSVQR